MTKNYYDFNNAEPQFSMIPAGTIAPVIIQVTSGGYGDDGTLTRNNTTGSVGLKVSFVITYGKYRNRKISQLIGIEGTKKDQDGKDIWGNMGRSLIRGILESANNILHTDDSPKAQEARKFASFKALDNLRCVVKIGIEEDKSGKHGDKNKVMAAITPDHTEYQTFMKFEKPVVEDIPLDVPF